MSDDGCGSASRSADPYLHTRIASIFVILITSLIGTLSPIVTKRVYNVPAAYFDFIKYFGSGVIIATAFIHLLAPGFQELSSPCLSAAWLGYPFPSAFAMASVFGLFFAELFAFRIGSRIVAKAGLAYDVHVGGMNHTHNEAGAATTAAGPNPHSHSHPTGITLDERDVEGQPKDVASRSSSSLKGDAHADHDHSHHHHDIDEEKGRHRALQIGAEVSSDTRVVLAQVVGIAILEFGVVLHSTIIGLTLAVDDAFKTLFVVIIFHQMFEGLGLGSRLASLAFPGKYRYIPYFAACLYSIMTPLGIAIGLGVRTTYNPDSTTASIVSGTLDSISAGVLLYTGLVELLAHEFLFNPAMQEASLGKLLYSCGCILLGAGIMALLGKWA